MPLGHFNKIKYFQNIFQHIDLRNTFPQNLKCNVYRHKDKESYDLLNTSSLYPTFQFLMHALYRYKLLALQYHLTPIDLGQ